MIRPTLSRLADAVHAVTPPPGRAALLSFCLVALGNACANLPTNSAPPATYDTLASDSGGGGAGADQDTLSDTAVVDTHVNDTHTGATDAADTTPAPDAKPEGTCQGRCNGPYNPGLPCQCNKDCPKFGNCCKDYGTLCDAGANTCVGRCDAPADVTKPCQCTWDCAKHGTCCPNFIASCHAKEALDWFAAPTGKCTKETDWVGVKFIPDGDTIVLDQQDSAGEDITVRFLLVDTPEMTSKDCYALDAKKFTVSAVQKSGKVCLVKESKSDDKDIYGRLLRYVFIKDASQVQPVELNLRLLQLGLGRVLYPFAKGNPYEPLALLTQAKAKEDGMGGWKACGW